MREATPRPSELTYMPPDSRPYKVTPDDNWWTLAARPDVTFSGMSALDLCFFNFTPRKPPEINWYLHHKVGCRTQTRDGNNFVFSAADDPGIVYLPKPGHPPPVGDVRTTRSGRLNTWIGIVGKAGTQFGPFGIETMLGPVGSLDEIADWMAVTVSVSRIGLGVGWTAGFAGIYIVGVSNPLHLNGHMEGEEFDFNLALGPNWGKAAKTASKTDKLRPLIEALRKVGARTPEAFKKALKTSPDKYADLADTCRSFNESLGIHESSEAKVMIFDVPWGSGGTEASAFTSVSTFHAVWDNL